MRKRSLFLIVLSTLASISMDASIAATGTPADVILDLRRLQDRIAGGDTIAEAAHAKTIARTAVLFAKMSPETWKDTRSARALIVYLFSGGNAQLIRQEIAPDEVSQDLRSLYSGALAYGLGEDAEAQRLLSPIDPKTMPNGVGGHLALVEAILVAGTDPAKAIALLDLARLLEPGTLIEEAALRKEMSLIGTTGDLEKFALLARRYLSTFPRSVYADNFRQMTANTAIQLGNANSDEAIARLTQLMSGLDKSERLRLYLLIAHDAVVAGRLKMASVSSQEAGHLAQGHARDEARALVYFGASAIVDDRYELAIKALSTIAPKDLGSHDRALRTSALALADMIRRPPSQGSIRDGADQMEAEIVAAAERSLSSSDALMHGAPK